MAVCLVGFQPYERRLCAALLSHEPPQHHPAFELPVTLIGLFIRRFDTKGVMHALAAVARYNSVPFHLLNMEIVIRSQQRCMRRCFWALLHPVTGSLELNIWQPGDKALGLLHAAYSGCRACAKV